MKKINKSNKKKYWIAYNKAGTIMNEGVTPIGDETVSGLTLDEFDTKKEKDTKLKILKK